MVANRTSGKGNQDLQHWGRKKIRSADIRPRNVLQENIYSSGTNSCLSYFRALLILFQSFFEHINCPLSVLTENCTLEPRKTMPEDQQGVLLGSATIRLRPIELFCSRLIKLAEIEYTNCFLALFFRQFLETGFTNPH